MLSNRNGTDPRKLFRLRHGLRPQKESCQHMTYNIAKEFTENIKVNAACMFKPRSN